jgi:hypothetical protein
MGHGSQASNILTAEQDTAWPADEHASYILLDPELFCGKKLVNLVRKEQ